MREDHAFWLKGMKHHPQSLTFFKCKYIRYKSHIEDFLYDFLGGIFQDEKGVTPELAEILVYMALTGSAFNSWFMLHTPEDTLRILDKL